MDEYDFTLNPYSGCSFGCTYCYAAFFGRTKEQRDSWGHWVTVKDNALALMERTAIYRPRRGKSAHALMVGESASGFLDGKRIYMSSVTDPYQPIERKVELTRQILEFMADGQKPKLVIQTRSPDVVRDCELLRRIVENGGRVQVNMTITTDDEDIRKTFEPFCPSNGERMVAISEVQRQGIDTCITMTPLLLVNDAFAFAEDLLSTGVEKFIVQPFHFQRGKFVASTRERAVELLCEKLGCERSYFRQEYMMHYERVLEVLESRLPNLGQGKEGFRPPF
jgi:DNA repair photolyase